VTVFTERLLWIETVLDEDQTLTVPESKRVVVKSVCAVNAGTQEGELWLQAHGIWCYRLFIPVATTVVEPGLQLVVYERETLRIATYLSEIGAMVSGYMFDDPIGAPSYPSLLPEGPLEPGPPRHLAAGP
jgi:hypothetical protein